MTVLDVRAACWTGRDRAGRLAEDAIALVVEEIRIIPCNTVGPVVAVRHTSFGVFVYPSTEEKDRTVLLLDGHFGDPVCEIPSDVGMNCLGRVRVHLIILLERTERIPCDR